MDALFWIGFVTCGAYVSFCFWSLAREERARDAETERARGDGSPVRRLSPS